MAEIDTPYRPLWLNIGNSSFCSAPSQRYYSFCAWIPTFSVPHSYSIWNLGCFPWTRLIVLGAAECEDTHPLYKSNYFRTNPNYMTTVSLIRTDGETTCHSSTALCVASRGNKVHCREQHSDRAYLTEAWVGSFYFSRMSTHVCIINRQMRCLLGYTAGTWRNVTVSASSYCSPVMA